MLLKKKSRDCRDLCTDAGSSSSAPHDVCLCQGRWWPWWRKWWWQRRGHGGGNSGGHGGQAGGHSGGVSSKGHNGGLKSDPAGKSVRNLGENGNHYGSIRNDSNGHGSTTSGVAHSKDTRGLSKATAISDTTPGDHNSKGLGNASVSSSKNDR